MCFSLIFTCCVITENLTLWILKKVISIQASEKFYGKVSLLKRVETLIETETRQDTQTRQISVVRGHKPKSFEKHLFNLSQYTFTVYVLAYTLFSM